MNVNIRFSGFGGQGIILSGVIYGQAAVLEGKNAIQTQSYGSESRGGACKSDVTISDEEIYELESPQVDVLVAMSQQAYQKYLSTLRDGGILIIDKDLVRTPSDAERRNSKDEIPIPSRSRDAAGIALHHPVQGLVTGKRATKPGVSTYAIPATDIAFKKFGRKIMANMVVLGYMTALLGIVPPEGLKEAIQENVPPGTAEMNIAAFEHGYSLVRSGGK